jgi:putative protease
MNDESLNRLELIFSRGFSTGWLEGVDPHRLVPGNIMSHRGIRLGTVIEVRRDAAVVQLSADVRRGDGILFENEEHLGQSQGGRVYEIIRRRESVMEAGGGAKVLLTFANNSIDAQFVKEGQSVWKTDDPKLQREIRKNLEARRPSRRVPLQMTVHAAVGSPLKITVQNSLGKTVHLTSEGNLEPARKHPMTPEVLQEQFARLGETIYTLDKFDAIIEGDPMVPLSVLGKLRREMIEQLDAHDPISVRTPVSVKSALEVIRNENASKYLQKETEAIAPSLHLLLRDVSLFKETTLKEIIDAGCNSFYAELRGMEEYKQAASVIRKVGAEFGAEFVAVLPRIIKPGESKFLPKIADLQPDAVLARNLEEIVFFHEQGTPVIADFSLNVVNDLSFYQLLDWGADRITFGFDLDETQYADLLQIVSAEKVEQIIAGRLPLFTMEHCLWQRNFCLPGEPCNKICRSLPLQLKDRQGALHSVRSDIFCRNIVENSEPIHVKPMTQHLRIEWDDRLGISPENIVRTASQSRNRKIAVSSFLTTESNHNLDHSF